MQQRQKQCSFNCGGSRHLRPCRTNRGQNEVPAQFNLGRRDIPGEARTVSVSDYGSEAQRTLLTGRGPGTGKPDPPKYTIYRGRPHSKNPRYCGFQGLLGVSCLGLQRLGSSVGFGTGTRMAPRKNLRALRVTCRERAAPLRPRVPRRAVLARTRGTRMWVLRNSLSS
jgi:hypothetical protein